MYISIMKGGYGIPLRFYEHTCCEDYELESKRKEGYVTDNTMFAYKPEEEKPTDELLR